MSAIDELRKQFLAGVELRFGSGDEEVFFRREIGKDRATLLQMGDAAARTVSARYACDIGAGQRDRSRRGADNTRDCLQEARLSGTVRTEQHCHFTCRHVMETSRTTGDPDRMTGRLETTSPSPISDDPAGRSGISRGEYLVTEVSRRDERIRQHLFGSAAGQHAAEVEHGDGRRCLGDEGNVVLDEHPNRAGISLMR